MRVGLPLMKSVFTPFPKNVLILIGVTAAASATDASNQKNIYGSGMTKLIFSNEQLNDIIKIVKSLKDSGLLIKGVSETVANEVKEQKRGFLGYVISHIRRWAIRKYANMYRTEI